MGILPGVRTISPDPEGNLMVPGEAHETRLEQRGVDKRGRTGDRGLPDARDKRLEQLESAGWAQVWNVVTGDPWSPELPHPAPVLHAAICGGGRGLVSTVTSDGEVRLWEASIGHQLWSEKPKEGMAVYSAFGCAARGIQLLVLIRGDPVSNGSYLRIYPLNSKAQKVDGVRTFRYEAPFTAALFSP